MQNYRTVKVSEIEFGNIRDIRPGVVEHIKNRIQQDGFNESRPLVVKNSTVVDGNHRLKALQELGHNGEVPVVETKNNIYSESMRCNRDEDTYAKMDLFDYLDIVETLTEEEGLTQKEAGERIGWSREKVAQHIALLNKIVTDVLDLARQHQEGRVTEDVTPVTFDFSEWWFRTSGLYGLDGEWRGEGEDDPKSAQLRFIEWFCNEKNCDTSKSKVKGKVDELTRIADQLAAFDSGISESVEDEKREAKREEIIRGELSDEQVKDAVQSLNRGAKDRYYFGEDALEKIRDLQDNEVDIVLTDPPYGVNFESRRETGNARFGTDKDQVLSYLSSIFTELERVCKENSHIYMFFPIDFLCDIKALAANHFHVDETPLIWVKNNHGPMTGGKSFKEMHAHKYETIFLFRMSNGYQRKLNAEVSPNVLEYPVPKGKDRWHDTQKPRELLKDIITNCTGTEEVVLDPFAGSGSTLLAAAEASRHFIGIEQDDSYESRFKLELGKVENGD